MLGPLIIVKSHLKQTLPVVERELTRVHRMAERIHDAELKSQALASIRTKRFHCDGGSVFATWLLNDGAGSGSHRHEAVVRFIVAFQTISDYLDNLCDRTGSLDERNFRRLHMAMFDALIPLNGLSADAQSHGDGDLTKYAGLSSGDYYRYHEYNDDGGYLAELVKICRGVVCELARYTSVKSSLETFVSLYVDLQVYKHIEHEKRVKSLTDWFSLHQKGYGRLFWWEFAAASGSTLAIFAFIAEAARDHPVCDPEKLQQTYFPSVCGLHILLDYLIDMEEDEREGDLNFVSYYKDQEEREKRISQLVDEALQGAGTLSDSAFHLAVVYGLLGLYLSDPKVGDLQLMPFVGRLIRKAGWQARMIRIVSVKWRRRTYKEITA